MKKKYFGCSWLVVLSLLLSTADAAPRYVYDDGENSAPVPWHENTGYLFGGLDLGYSQYGAYTPATEGKRSGFDGGLRALLAVYWPKWVVDGGLGYRYISNSGTNADNSESKVTTRAGFLDFSPRYRLNQNWQLGPELQYWLTGDNGLNPNPQSDDKNTSAWIGAQLMYEWMSDDTKFRLGGRFLTDMNVDGRTVDIFQAFFQIGFSIFGSDHGDEYAPRHRNEQVSDRDIERAEEYTEPKDPLPIATPEPEATPWATPNEPLPIPTPEVPTIKPKLAYRAARGTVGKEMDIRPSVFDDGGVSVLSCTASPDLPEWASIDPTRCVITGTPTEVMSPTMYTITATNQQGQSTSARIILSVGPSKAKPQERFVLTLDVNDLPFAFDSARLPKYNADRVREIGRFLGEHKDKWTRLVVEGHTDERGSNTYNDHLSKARADTVRQLLIEGGAPYSRIKSVGYGERHPKVRGHNEKAWAKNRRVELVFKGVKDVVIMKNAIKH